MSRIGRNPITVPSSVTVSVSGSTVSVKGPNGSMERSLPGGLTVTQEGDTLTVVRPNDERDARSLHGLTRNARDFEDLAPHIAEMASVHRFTVDEDVSTAGREQTEHELEERTLARATLPG